MRSIAGTGKRYPEDQIFAIPREADRAPLDQPSATRYRSAPSRPGSKLARGHRGRALAAINRLSGRDARQHGAQALHSTQPIPEPVPSWDSQGRHSRRGGTSRCQRSISTKHDEISRDSAALGLQSYDNEFPAYAPSPLPQHRIFTSLPEPRNQNLQSPPCNIPTSAWAYDCGEEANPIGSSPSRTERRIACAIASAR